VAGGNADPSVVAFQVSRPGLILDVKADVERGHVSVHRHALNAWASRICFTPSPACVPATRATGATGC
jgi:hypothetical protein